MKRQLSADTSCIPSNKQQDSCALGCAHCPSAGVSNGEDGCVCVGRGAWSRVRLPERSRRAMHSLTNTSPPHNEAIRIPFLQCKTTHSTTRRRQQNGETCNGRIRSKTGKPQAHTLLNWNVNRMCGTFERGQYVTLVYHVKKRSRRGHRNYRRVHSSRNWAGGHTWSQHQLGCSGSMNVCL
jgi:hypothetical protein